MKKIIAAILFISIWVLGCFLNAAVFHIETMAYIMWYGFGVGTLSATTYEIITNP